VDNPPNINHSLLNLLLARKEIQVHAHEYGLVYCPAFGWSFQQNLQVMYIINTKKIMRN